MVPRFLSTPQPSLLHEMPPANRFRILVVDDMLANRVLLRKILTMAGYEVLEVENGEDAISLLADEETAPFDLIVTDIEMPGISGIELVAAIRRDGYLSPIIAASGNADEEMREQSLSAGADLFLTKPFDIPKLRQHIGRLIQPQRLVPQILPTPAGGRVEDFLEQLSNS